MITTIANIVATNTPPIKNPKVLRREDYSPEAVPCIATRTKESQRAATIG